MRSGSARRARSATLEPIIERLQGRQALIVLDNFEHMLAAAAELGRFLTACPELTALVTSRSPLRLREEREVPLERLETPPAATAGPAVVGQSPAVQLFVARAVAVDGVRPDDGQRRRRGRALPAAGTASRWPSNWPPSSCESSRRRPC